MCDVSITPFLMRILTLFLAALSLYTTPCSAQDIVKQHPMQGIELDSLARSYYAALEYSFNAWDSSVVGATHKHFTIDGDTYHLFVYERMDEYGETWTPDLDAKLVVVNGVGTYGKKLWQTSMGPLGYPTQINYAHSTAFSANGAIYLKLIYKEYNDLVDRGWVDFFALEGDSLRSVGHLALYERDDPSGGEIELYDGSLLPFKSSPEGVLITLKRDHLSTYNIDYLLTPTALKLIKNHEPEFHISLEEAQLRIDHIFERYYDQEEEISNTENRHRASFYVQEFERLIKQRHDFAPAYYNAGCMHAILGHINSAIPALKRAFELDPEYIEKAKTDPDLDLLRKHAEFLALFE